MNLYQKLHKIQSQVLGLGKDKDGQNYKYVTGSKVLEHLKPLMNELGIILKQEVLSIENVRQDYSTSLFQNQETKIWSGKPKSEILSKVMMRFTWIDCESGDKDENLFGANGQNDWDKGVGSALTYAERYFLLKYFHIATDEDDIDNPDRKPEDAKEPEPPKETTKPPASQNSNSNQEDIDKLNACKTLAELQDTFAKIKVKTTEIVSLKDKLKLTLK